MDYVVKPGDTLAGLANRFGVTKEAILAVNPQITNPNLIYAGQHITIPISEHPRSVYTVKPGDTLYNIAQRFGFTLGQLLAANPQITNPDAISIGQRINIPGAPPTIPPPMEENIYEVQPGDSLFLIARRFNTSVDELLRLNPGINPDLIYPGQELKVPLAPPATGTAPGCIVFLSDRSGRLEIWRNNTKGTSPLQLTAPPETPEEPVSNPRWSPDGNRVAYLSGNQLFIVDPCGRNLKRLAENATDYSWANDGNRLAYSNENGSFIVDLNGNTRTVSSRLFHPVWFRGDQRLAGTVTIEDLNYPVLVTVETSGANYRIYDKNPVVPASDVILSPDGRYAATFLFKGAAYLITAAVWIYDFSQNKLTRLPGQELPAGINQTVDLSYLGGWAPDSSRFVYSTIVAANGRSEIRISNPQGEIIQRIPRDYYPEVSWGPTNDWIIIAVSATPGQAPLENTRPRKIVIRNLQTGTETTVANQGDNLRPDWSAKICPTC